MGPRIFSTAVVVEQFQAMNDALTRRIRDLEDRLDVEKVRVLRAEIDILRARLEQTEEHFEGLEVRISVLEGNVAPEEPKTYEPLPDLVRSDSEPSSDRTRRTRHQRQ